MDALRAIGFLLDRWIISPFRPKRSKLNSMDLNGIANHLKACRKVIVMTGAGISTNANIPDFRSESFGLYNRLQKYNLPHPTAVFTLDYFKHDARPFYDIAHELYPIMDVAKPTVAHYFIKLLDSKGVLLRHYTQNIDGLEDFTGLDLSKTIQAHGHIRSGSCLDCRHSHPFEYLKERVIVNEIPKCEKCSGVIKPDVVLFGESLPSGFWKHMVDFPKCDLLIIMGTSLVVQPFAGLANKVGYDCPRLLINRDPVGDPNMFGSTLTSILGLNPNFGNSSNSHRDLFCQDDCDRACMQLATLMGWDGELKEMIRKGNEEIDKKRQERK
jgi:NAD-dependent deacetylase sirtuin 2